VHLAEHGVARVLDDVAAVDDAEKALRLAQLVLEALPHLGDGERGAGRGGGVDGRGARGVDDDHGEGGVTSESGDLMAWPAALARLISGCRA
jgi:hypothetical protein